MAKKKTHKMDQHLISQQAWEIEYVRLRFYKKEGNKIVHPDSFMIKEAVSWFNNSRKKVYASLLKYNWIRIK